MDIISSKDTICAIATPVGEGGIGIIRLSGPRALPIALALFRPAHPAGTLPSHQLHYGWIEDKSSGAVVDEVLLSYMEAPRTYTREDVVEINCHSGYAVLNRILQLVLRSGARLAEPGEFTRRAFLNGRIDLSQAEAVAELIHARSEQDLILANRQLRGALRSLVETWHRLLLQLHSEVEASIDFSEDLEGEFDLMQEWPNRLQHQLIDPLTATLAASEQGQVLREGLTIVLVGKPNVGKSSLLNILVGEDRAIVTPFPGTTRDVIEDSFLLSGVQVRVLDTAGIRRQPDAIESLGIERALQSAERADAVLWLLDSSRDLDGEDDAIFARIFHRDPLILLNKADLPQKVTPEEVHNRYAGAAPVLHLSIFDAADIETLRSTLKSRFLDTPLDRCRSGLVPNVRQQERLRLSLEALNAARNMLADGHYPELVSFELGAARRHLEAILGWGAEEALLDDIFSRFCVGK